MDIKCNFHHHLNYTQVPERRRETNFCGAQRAVLRRVCESADKFVRRPVATTSATGLQGLETVVKKSSISLMERLSNFKEEYVYNIKHTVDHKIVFAIIEKELFGKMSTDSLTHDLDKLVLYLAGFKKDFVSKIHRNHSEHHFESGKKANLRSMLCDNVASNPIFKPEKKLALREFYKNSDELQNIKGLGDFFESHNFGENVKSEKVLETKKHLYTKLAAGVSGVAQIVPIILSAF